MAIEERPDVEVLTPPSLPAVEEGLGEAGGQAPAVEPAPPPKALPVRASERVSSVDVLRGVALLGILAMNIVGFGWPMSVYETPTRDPDAGALDVGLWAFNHVVFDTKMMTTFSMLFGAGLVLMDGRASARGAKLGGVYYRRIAWLLAIGLIHAYLIWDGDILVMYALCGFLLYPFRNLRPRTLIVTGAVFNLLLVPLVLAFVFLGVPWMKATAGRVEAMAKEGKKPNWWEEKVASGWKEMSSEKKPNREKFLEEVRIHRGGYLGIVKNRAGELAVAHTIGFVMGMWWFAGGRMLIGMGLMKLGVFAAERSREFYLRLVVVGYGIGVPLMLFDVYHHVANNFFEGHRLAYFKGCWMFITIYGSLFVVFGHIGAVMLLCQSGALPWLTKRLGAVGRTALSNYLFDSLLFTTLFYGYGFDYFGSLHRPMLYLLVLTAWLGQLLFSKIWLDVFNYGPAEWVWRSLTYWKPQPMLRRAEGGAMA